MEKIYQHSLLWYYSQQGEYYSKTKFVLQGNLSLTSMSFDYNHYRKPPKQLKFALTNLPLLLVDYYSSIEQTPTTVVSLLHVLDGDMGLTLQFGSEKFY